MEQYNEQAANYVFRANNAGCAGDEIDLHGLHVEEAKFFTEQRIITAKQRGEDHLHIIVGKGIHSADHVAKLKPAIEDLCRKHQFEYSREHNEGRIYVKFTGGAQGVFPAPGPAHYVQQPQQAYHPQQQPSYAFAANGNHFPNQQQNQGQQQQYQQQANSVIRLLKSLYRTFCR